VRFERSGTKRIRPTCSGPESRSQGRNITVPQCAPQRVDSSYVDPEYRQRRAEAATLQRTKQQGLGKPILSAELKGQRFVAVKNRLFHSERFKTFHDFLVRYAMQAHGPSWGTAELSKPSSEQHPIARWYQSLCRHQRKFMSGSGKVTGLPYSGGTAAFMQLAYDLYELDHNAELQEVLLKRLRNPLTFSGARYETYVAAVFIRAGFGLAFENEQDGSTTHCEFTASHRTTGKKFSVEAKRREGRRLRLGRLFNDALSKQANHTRVVFMDVNTPDNDRGESRPPFMEVLLRRLRASEGQRVNGQPRPPAYLVMTNMPWEYDLDGPAARSTFLAEGFQIPDFKDGVMYPTIRAMINAREAHGEMHGLMRSIAEHSRISSTFDGELDVYAHEGSPVRVMVGSRYLFPTKNGKHRVGLVTSAEVLEGESNAYCAVTFGADEPSAIYDYPLSKAELAEYQQHKETFFGVRSLSRVAKTPLDLYDFVLETYQRSSKEKLLELMKTWPDQERLMALEQSELASMYAESIAANAWKSGNRI
jgi:hypothetical protein